MDLQLIKTFLLRNLSINYLIIVWFAVSVFAHDDIYWLHNRWLPLLVEHRDVIHYLSISIYKIGVLLFNLAPYFVLLYLTGRGLAKFDRFELAPTVDCSSSQSLPLFSSSTKCSNAGASCEIANYLCARGALGFFLLIHPSG
ncbi:DUF6868 family protein [Aeromonas veronii]|uniref:DUF6868 family protein n=1 Tax=Aeromonas veronii TaxID=654 RepID=UPI003BA353BB